VRPPTVALTTVAAVAVLIAGWHQGSQVSSGVVAGVHLVAAPPAETDTPTSSGSASATPAGSAKPKKRNPIAQRRVIDGGIAQTQYGNVQVRLVVVGHTITDVRAIHLTDANDHSRGLSAGAAPILRHEALAAQSAKIDTVSGATYTSEGYRQSLQAAIDQAHL
jgi:uncharacterized protein with FMN-binding domain